MAKAVPVHAAEAEASAIARGRWLAFSKRFNAHVLPRLVLIPLCFVFILPLYWMIAVGLKPVSELSVYPPTLWPDNPRWTNFKDAVDTIPFWRYLWNTSLITLLTVVGSAISNPIVAYGFSRIEWPGRDKVFALVLATVFIPFPVLIVALFDIYARLPRPIGLQALSVGWEGWYPVVNQWPIEFGGNWINTYLPLVVPLFFGNAFWIFLMRQFFMQIPKDLSDAARLDGANDFRILFQIILPQAYPAVAVICIFAALHAWNDFFGPLIFLQDPDKYTLAVGLTFFQSQQQYDIQYNLLMAASVLVVLPVVVVFLLFQRAFIQGVTVSSFK